MRINNFICCLISCILLCSCKGATLHESESSIYNPSDLLANDYPFAKETAIKVIELIDNQNRDDLEKMLSESVLLQNNVDEQMDELFDFCSDYELSYDKIISDIASSDYREEKYIFKGIRIIIEGALVNGDEECSMEFYYILVDDENPSNIGITKISFRDEQGMFVLKLFE